MKAEDNGEVFTVVENVKAEKVTSTITDGEPKPNAADPIMAPKDHVSSEKVQKQLGLEPSKPIKTVVKYDKSPKPMSSRWWSPKRARRLRSNRCGWRRSKRSRPLAIPIRSSGS